MMPSNILAPETISNKAQPSDQMSAARLGVSPNSISGAQIDAGVWKWVGGSARKVSVAQIGDKAGSI